MSIIELNTIIFHSYIIFNIFVNKSAWKTIEHHFFTIQKTTINRIIIAIS